MANGVVSLTLLRGQHAKIVPGFRIVWAQLDGLFEVLPRFWQGILAEVDSAKIVVGLWILRLGINDLLEGSGGLVEIAVLKHGNAVSEIIALDRKSTRLNSSHVSISYAVFCLKKKRSKSI